MDEQAAEAQPQRFGDVLRRLRRTAGLTQEALAQRAGVSARAIADLERGINLAPRRDTLQMLAAALGLSAAERAALAAAAHRSGPVERRIARAVAATDGIGVATPVDSRAPTSNLPAQLTSFIGRERERDEVLAQLGQSRLVTLTGTGGAGKTRLALAVAAELLGAYPAGVWLVDLAPLAGAASDDLPVVAQAVTEALGVREEAGTPLVQTLADYLKDRRLLLLLDNCEHLVAACAMLASTLLRACQHVHILATSREGLRITGERCWRVPSLTVPDPKHLPPPELAASYEAVRLFVARARRPGFALTTQNVRAVTSICARLDGMPLAIELAAARVGSVPVEVIAARLNDRFALLTGGPRDAVPRQRTLRATLDWSHDLLREDERLLLAQLSVFAGGWTLDAAEAVCAGDGIAATQVLELLASLESKSLLLLEDADTPEDQGRYRLLETVRQYAAERLHERGEEAAARDRHLAWYVALTEGAEQQLRGPDQGRWLAMLEAEHDNLRAAMGWARDQGAAEDGLRLAGSLWRFWWTRGYLAEGRGWLEAALAGDRGSPMARAKALTGAGNLAYQQGDYGRAASLHEEALELRRALEDMQGIAASLHSLGIVAHQQGEFERAAELYEDALARSRALADKAGMAGLLGNLGHVAHAQGHHARAVALVEEALTLFRELSDMRNIAASLHLLGNLAHEQGDHLRAMAMHEEALALFRVLGDTLGIAGSLNILGRVAFAQCEYVRAEQHFEEGMRLCRTMGAQDELAEGLEGLVWVAAATGEPGRAARLGGAAEALREALGVPLVLERRAAHELALLAVRPALGEAFEAAWAMGRGLTLDEAVGLALVNHAEQS